MKFLLVLFAFVAIAFAQTPEPCENGNQRCVGTSSWESCANGVWFQQPVPASTECSQFNATAVEFTSPPPPCGELGSSSCASASQYTVCAPSGDVVFNVPAGTECAVVNGTVQFQQLPPPCGVLGKQTCLSESQYTVCSPSGDVVFDSPVGTKCVQNGDEVSFENNGGEECGGLGRRTCSQDKASYELCTNSGAVVIEVPEGTECNQFNATAVELVNLAQEQADEQAAEIERLKAQLAESSGVAVVVPSFFAIVLGVAQLFF